MPGKRKVVNPSLECGCGCGKQTPNAYSYYIHGHEHRKSIVDYIVDENGCWIWQLAINTHGYGSMRVGKSNLGAHRVYYERLVGPIPEGMQLDHTCRNRRCVNPAHLEPVTVRENIRRGDLCTIDNAMRAEVVRLNRDGKTQAEVAAALGIHQSSVSTILMQDAGDSRINHRARGERGGLAKLTEDDVREMRRLAAEGWTQIALGERFGVSNVSAGNVVHRRTWRHVE